MGYYAECWLGALYVGSTKNDYDPELIRLFRSSDKAVCRGTKQDLPFQMRRWAKRVEEEDEVDVVFYRAPVSIVRDRLELKGYTLPVAKGAFAAYRGAAIDDCSQYLDQYRELYEPTSRFLESTGVDEWLEALRFIKDHNLEPVPFGEVQQEYIGTRIEYMLKNDWYGYPGYDLSLSLRLALEVCSDRDEFIYDVTELYYDDYSIDEDLVQCTFSAASDHFSSNEKSIVLTEGSTDSWIVSESLRLLYPHLADHFTFVDFEAARVGGGSGNLANIVKTFAGAGIVNRVLAVFDNDTAAEAAIRSIRNVRLPKTIRILKLPEFSALDEYPTIGPSGMVSMNINGVAGGIELYLGADILTDEKGIRSPIQWTGYEPSLNKYQGEVLSKGKIQERFRRKLDLCRTDPEMLIKTDWSGIHAILRCIFGAFHELDSERIMRLATDTSP